MKHAKAHTNANLARGVVGLNGPNQLRNDFCIPEESLEFVSNRDDELRRDTASEARVEKSDESRELFLRAGARARSQGSRLDHIANNGDQLTRTLGGHVSILSLTDQMSSSKACPEH